MEFSLLSASPEMNGGSEESMNHLRETGLSLIAENNELLDEVASKLIAYASL